MSDTRLIGVVNIVVISFPDPIITVGVTASAITLMAGSMHSLTCTVSGAEKLSDATTTYQWFKNGVMVSGQTMETLSFSPLTFSGAGSYTCQATVMSSLLSTAITTSRADPASIIRLTCKLYSYVHIVC